MFIKSIVLLIMLIIIVSLISGLLGLLNGNSKQTVKALTWRIALSFALFLFLMLAFKLQWITPHLLWTRQ